MSGAHHRRKGPRVERAIVDQHRALGIRAERYPLSGNSHLRGSRHDIDVYPLGRDEPPFVAEVEARANRAGLNTLEGWLGGYDLLFLRRNGVEPLVVVPSHVWARILGEVRR